MSGTILAGSIEVIPLADILLLLNNNRKTGALRCQRAGVSKVLEWENGEIVFARSSIPEDRLGAYLLARGDVTADHMRKAGPLVDGQDRLGKTLVKIGALTPAKLWTAVRGQVTEIIYSLFHWETGSFEFRIGNPPPEKISLDASVMQLIIEGTRRLDEWSRVKEKISSDAIVLASVKSIGEVSKSVTLSEYERTVHELVDGRRTVREVIDHAGKGEFDTWQALHSLLSGGVIRIQLLAFDRPESAPKRRPTSDDDEVLERTLDRYSRAVEEILIRAEQAVGPDELTRIRKRLREATFDHVDLLRDVAIERDGRMDRRVLLANVAEDPPKDRSRNLQAALESLLRFLGSELQGKVSIDDVLTGLRRHLRLPAS